MALLTVELTDDASGRLQEIAQKLGDMRPILKVIGEELTESTKRRFETSTGPDGTRWEENAESTLLGYMKSKTKGSLLTKRGNTKASAVKALARKRPLIGETKQLSTKISYRLDGDTTLLVGSPLIYASTHQFGRGHIPARPFLGISTTDESMIKQELINYLSP